MKYYKATISGNNYLGEFSIKYSLTKSPTTFTLANLAGTSTPAINLTYSQMTTGGGVAIEVPDNVAYLKIIDEDGNCPDTLSPLLQTIPTLSLNNYYLSTGFNFTAQSCGYNYNTLYYVGSEASSISTALGEDVYIGNGLISEFDQEYNTLFEGQNKYYLVSTFDQNFNTNNTQNWYWQINNNGQITDVIYFNCNYQLNP